MSTYEKIYWLTRLDYLQGIFLVISIILGVILAGAFLFSLIQGEWFIKKWQIIVGPIVLFIVVLTTSLIPTKQEAIFIVAAGKTIDFVQTDTSVTRIPGLATKVVANYLQKEIDNDTVKTVQVQPAPIQQNTESMEMISDFIKTQVKQQIEEAKKP